MVSARMVQYLLGLRWFLAFARMFQPLVGLRWFLLGCFILLLVLDGFCQDGSTSCWFKMVSARMVQPLVGLRWFLLGCFILLLVLDGFCEDGSTSCWFEMVSARMVQLSLLYEKADVSNDAAFSLPLLLP